MEKGKWINCPLLIFFEKLPKEGGGVRMGQLTRIPLIMQMGKRLTGHHHNNPPPFNYPTPYQHVPTRFAENEK